MIDFEKMLYEAENAPNAEVLEDAPALAGWWIARGRNHLHARGSVSGHPTIDDPFVTTSPVIGFNIEEGWMRTRSRYYRLGKPMDLGAFKIIEALDLDQAQSELAEIRRLLKEELAIASSGQCN